MSDNDYSEFSRKFSHLYEEELADDESALIYSQLDQLEERYIHPEEIAQGGMKKIIKTTDSITNRPVAKAVLLDFEDSDKVENFLREARLTAALEHPNIIPVYEMGLN